MESAEFTNEALSELQVRPVERNEERRYQEQMAQHHSLGDLPKIGQTLWYIATWREQWVAQLSLSAAALKCGVRDRWIGWDFRSQYGRLKLIANNSRFLILPDWHRPNIGSSNEADAPKRVFVRPLCRDPRARLTHPNRDALQLTGAAKIMLNAEQMRSLPQCFTLIADPRRAQGRRHRLPVVLGIAAGATLCGTRGYKAISD